MCRPSRVNWENSMMASSPKDRASSPARTYASAPSSEAPIAAGAHPNWRASSSQASIAGGHDSGSPIGSALARLTPFTTR